MMSGRLGWEEVYNGNHVKEDVEKPVKGGGPYQPTHMLTVMVTLRETGMRRPTTSIQQGQS